MVEGPARLSHQLRIDVDTDKADMQQYGECQCKSDDRPARAFIVGDLSQT